MPAVVLDVNVILRFLLADHAEYAHAANLTMARVKSGHAEAFVPESVVAESVFVLGSYYNVPRQQIVRWLCEVLSYRGVIGDRADIQREALELFTKSSVSVVDALALVHAERNGYELVTFDRKLKNLAARRAAGRV